MQLPLLAFLPLSVLGLRLPGHVSLPHLIPRQSTLPKPSLTPDGTCGPTSPGNYFCTSDNTCCSSHGYCGNDDAHCLTTNGCQDAYSFPGVHKCRAPRDGITVSADGTCGKVGAGTYGYICPARGLICCSQYGYCGNLTAHCWEGNGCQKDYGYCTLEGV